MQTAPSPQTEANPFNRILLPMDGGLSIAQGIPAFDPDAATYAYASAAPLINTISPAPEALDIPAPFEAPSIDIEDLDPEYTPPAPRPPMMS